MSISKVKNLICDSKNKKILFKFNGNRNQIEEFYGTITDTYQYVFVVKLSDKDMVKSFSYADVLIGNLQLIVK